MSNILVFTDQNNNLFKVDKNTALKLEVSLNLTKYGKPWRNIGDILYNFAIGRNTDLLIKITNEQLNFLKNLNCKK